MYEAVVMMMMMIGRRRRRICICLCEYSNHILYFILRPMDSWRAGVGWQFGDLASGLPATPMRSWTRAGAAHGRRAWTSEVCARGPGFLTCINCSACSVGWGAGVGIWCRVPASSQAQWLPPGWHSPCLLCIQSHALAEERPAEPKSVVPSPVARRGRAEEEISREFTYSFYACPFRPLDAGSSPSEGLPSQGCFPL